VDAEIDPVALDEVFTFWSTLSPRSIFKGIFELPAGHFLVADGQVVEVKKYWELDFSGAGVSERKPEEYLDEFRALLIDATKKRLRADVPVGAYLSGGLDSSTITGIIRKHSNARLETFSIAFSEGRFDESRHQMRMAKFLKTEHQVVFATHEEIGRVFPEVIWHAETPLMRTAPAPMFLLSKLVRAHGYKVVLTGEGADELLAGYDIFKEAKIRAFCARRPESKWRSLLFQRLYRDIIEPGQNSPAFLAAFFGDGHIGVDAPEYSHAVRWRNNRRTRRFFSDDVMAGVERELEGAGHEIFYPARFSSWGPLERAQYLESTIFLSEYLLSSQGDRMGMAHSVEGRFPFLDHRVVEFCCRLPARLKLRGLREKYLLKKLGAELLPDEIWRRLKRPYRAPIHRSFFNQAAAPYVRELLSEEQIQAAGLFKAGAVAQLVKKIDCGLPLSETDEMALAGIVSSQLLQGQFVACFRGAAAVSEKEDVKVCAGTPQHGRETAPGKDRNEIQQASARN
jgi:asparagine synthase (glutamine-hydrolysing)